MRKRKRSERSAEFDAAGEGMAKKWFSMCGPKAESKAGSRVGRIDISGVIGWEPMAAEFLSELKDLGEVDVIDLRIHSPGGSVLDGWAIANALKAHPAKVLARVEGMAASMASVIAMSADVLSMPKNAYLMIHNVTNIAIGNVEDLRAAADLTEKLQDGIVDFYAERSGQDRDAIIDMMDAETWMDGEEAVALGFADICTVAQKAAACLPGELAGTFRAAPAGLFDAGVEGMATTAEISPAPEVVEEVTETTETEETVETAETVVDPEAETEETVEETATSWLDRTLNFLTGKAAKPTCDAAVPSNALEESRGLCAMLREDNERISNELTDARSQIAALEAKAKKVWDLCAEAGFPATAALPAPSGEEGPATTDDDIRAEFAAMEPGEERSAFFAKHKAILSISKR